MTLQIIIGVLLVTALLYAWYNERLRRRDAELERDIALERVVLDGIQAKLDKNKPEYDAAQLDMFEHLGLPDPQSARWKKQDDGTILDTHTGKVIRPLSPDFPA